MVVINVQANTLKKFKVKKEIIKKLIEKEANLELRTWSDDAALNTMLDKYIK